MNNNIKISNVEIHSLFDNAKLERKLNYFAQSRDKQMKDFEQVLQQYESIILSRLLESIFENKEPDPLTGGGFEEKILNSFLIQEYAIKMVQSNKLNITKDIRKQLLGIYQYNNQYGKR